MNINKNDNYLKNPVTASCKIWNEMLSNTGGFCKYYYRSEYIKDLGFCIVTTETENVLATFLSTKKVVDIGARTGFLSKILSNKGVNVTAVDIGDGSYFGVEYQKIPKWYNIQIIDATQLDLSSFDVILLSWPDYEKSTAYDIIKNMKKGQILVYEGEGPGGCTADDNFHDYLKNFMYLEDITDRLNEHHIQFPGIYDWWAVYEAR